jgi:hypothetical protein
MSHYNISAIFDELQFILSKKNQYDPASDKALTYINRMKAFSAYDKSMFLQQVRQWKAQRCVVEEYNIKEVEVGDKRVFLFIVQDPANMESMPICPLALACGVMVSGYSYITHDRKLAEYVMKTLKAARSLDE